MPNRISLALIVVLAMVAATAPAEAVPALLSAPAEISKGMSDSVILVKKGKGGKGDGDERYERYHRHEGRWHPHHRRHYHGMRAMHRYYGHGHYEGGRGNRNQPDGQN
jgi:hypothetical protein